MSFSQKNISNRTAETMADILFRYGARSRIVIEHDRSSVIPPNTVMGARTRPGAGWEMIYMDVMNITADQVAAFLDEAQQIQYKHILVSLDNVTRIGFANTLEQQGKLFRPGIIGDTIKRRFSNEDGNMKTLEQLSPRYMRPVSGVASMIAAIGAIVSLFTGGIGLTLTVAAFALIFAFIWYRSGQTREA